MYWKDKLEYYTIWKTVINRNSMVILFYGLFWANKSSSEVLADGINLNFRVLISNFETTSWIFFWPKFNKFSLYDNVTCEPAHTDGEVYKETQSLKKCICTFLYVYFPFEIFRTVIKSRSNPDDNIDCLGQKLPLESKETSLSNGVDL